LLPTFIGIGAQRAGTTWAYNCLVEHPDVFMTKKKELHFFYVNYERGLPWYEEQFAEAGGRPARGEITPDYLYHDAALQNIARDVPDVRLFVILRNPVDRALSQYALHKDRVGGASFASVARPDSEFVDRGLYFKHLKVVYSHFAPERVKVMLYDDLERTPAAFVSELYEFVGVDPDFRPASLRTRYNRVIYPGLQRKLLDSRMGWLIDAVKASRLGDWIRGRHSGHRRDGDEAKPSDVGRLVEYFQDDVACLAQMLDRDLSHWLR
jgi:hypothetical protein